MNKKYEYKVYLIKHFYLPFDDEISEFGKVGWELVSASGDSGYHTLFFKRELLDNK